MIALEQVMLSFVVAIIILDARGAAAAAFGGFFA
jgi:hypothetical protein